MSLFNRLNFHSLIFLTVSPYVTEVSIPPSSWTSGLLLVVYWSFDYDKYIELENGTQLVDGKVSSNEFFQKSLR